VGGSSRQELVNSILLHCPMLQLYSEYYSMIITLLPGGGKRLINGHHTSTAVDSLTQKRESVLPKTEDQSLVTTSKSRLYVHQLISMCIDSNKRLSLESSVNEQIASQHLEHCFERTYSPLVSPTRDLGIGESD
jgi:hypothetical protein